MKKILISIFFVVTFLFCSSGEQNPRFRKADGEIVNGKRVISADAETEKIYVYRGDSVILKFKEICERDSVKIPGIKIKDIDFNNGITLLSFKAKKAGEYKINMGNFEMELTVVEYKAEGIYKKVNAKEAYNLISTVAPLILDVRTTEEYSKGHIKNSVLIPVQVLAERIDELEEYKDKPVLVYCRSGVRSTTASAILVEAGFREIYNLRSGINGWIKKGLETVSGGK